MLLCLSLTALVTAATASGRTGLKRNIALRAEIATERNIALRAEIATAGKHPATTSAHHSLPPSFTWANVDGQNFLTSVRNQHQPVYCGSCWAMASTSSLADRLSIAHGNSARRFHLSVQTVLGCGHKYRGNGTDPDLSGNCDGGDDADVYLYASKHGIPSESCSNYMATDTTCLETQPVSLRNKPECYTCQPRDNSGNDRCARIKRFKKLYVERFGVCSGYDAMKQEIHERGPITCSIDATDDQDNYVRGIYSLKNSTLNDLDHVISIVGWGVDNKTGDEYWWLRNSWGSFWGLDGYMKIVTSRNTGPKGRLNNGVELECAYGVVTTQSWRHQL